MYLAILSLNNPAPYAARRCIVCCTVPACLLVWFVLIVLVLLVYIVFPLSWNSFAQWP